MEEAKWNTIAEEMRPARRAERTGGDGYCLTAPIVMPTMKYFCRKG